MCYVFSESSQVNANHICKPSIYSVPETYLALSEDLVNKWINLEGKLLKDHKYYLKKKSYECKNLPYYLNYISGYLTLHLIAYLRKQLRNKERVYYTCQVKLYEVKKGCISLGGRWG